MTVTGPVTITTPPGPQPGAGVPALLAINGGSITSSGPISLEPGTFGLGADARTLSSITIGSSAGSTITTQGFGTDGLRALGPGSQISATDFKVMTSGNFSDGVLAQGGGVISLQNGRVTTAGNNANGLDATGVGSQIIATNVDVVTTGGLGVATAATNGGQLTINGGTVTTSGGGDAAGIMAFNAGRAVATGTTFNIAGSPGVDVFNGSAVELHSVTLTTNSFGIFTNNAFGLAPSTVLVDGGSLTAVRPIHVEAIPATITLENGAVLTATQSTSTGLIRLMEVVTGGDATLNASSSTLTGSIFTEPGSTSTVNLTNGTVWNIRGGLPPLGPENSNVTNLTNNASTINFPFPTGDPTLPSSYLTLTTVTYGGVGGTLGLNTFLGADNSPSDKLVIDGGSGSGSTTILVRNTGGPGAETTGNGILVVNAINGGTTTLTAFSLAGGRVTAGAFDYVLFRGGVSQGSQDSWFLRSSLVAPPLTPAGTPAVPTPTPAPGSPPLPDPVPGDPPIPLFDPEVALKSVVPSVARTLGLVTLGTFNERQGDQLLLRGDLKVGAWGRVFGQQTREHFAEGARPDFDGTFAGFQAGADLLRLESSNGHSDHIGFYVAQARASGAVHGLVDAFEGAPAGHVDLNATSYGGYWTHLGPSNWYIDAVLQGTYFQTAANSNRGVANNFSGRGFAASIEGGYPIPLVSWLTFEPQIQGIWQRTSFDDSLGEGFSTITYDRSNVFTGRVGALLRGTFGGPGAVWQPYLKGNVWWGSNGFDTVRFDADPIQTGRNGGTTLEGGGGVTGKLARNVSVYGDASYLESVSGEQRITLKGNVGLRVTW